MDGLQVVREGLFFCVGRGVDDKVLRVVLRLLLALAKTAEGDREDYHEQGRRDDRHEEDGVALLPGGAAAALAAVFAADVCLTATDIFIESSELIGRILAIQPVKILATVTLRLAALQEAVRGATDLGRRLL